MATKNNERDEYLDERLSAFPYVNGGLFTEEDKKIPQFNAEIKKLLLESGNFTWEKISPTIFGAVFESTLNQQTRRSGGMHYTSIENIHKVIDPLFMNSLTAEFEQIKAEKIEKTRNQKLKEFQQKIGNLKFLDPACGSGNFLTESFMSLRRLENECIRMYMNSQNYLGFTEKLIFVDIHQFYGIEINDFAVSVAKTALWIADSQMKIETMAIIDHDMDFLPLKNFENIVEGNALQIDWASVYHTDLASPNGLAEETCHPELSTSNTDRITCHPEQTTCHPERTTCHPELVSGSHFDYNMGNPPFVGARLMNQDQKDDLLSVFGKDWKNIGNLDYVCGWYKKATDLIQNTKTHCALVSTNSICQGETVANLWKPLFENGIQIDFAHRTFRWDSESNLKAHNANDLAVKEAYGFAKDITESQIVAELFKLYEEMLKQVQHDKL